MSAIATFTILTLSFIIKMIIKLRLAFPAAYIILMNTALRDWQHSHEFLSIAGLAIIMAGVVASWIVTIVNFVRER